MNNRLYTNSYLVGIILFNFEPKAIFIFNANSNYAPAANGYYFGVSFCMFFKGGVGAQVLYLYTQTGGGIRDGITNVLYTFADNGISWHTTSTDYIPELASAQYNTGGTTYGYVVMG